MLTYKLLHIYVYLASMQNLAGSALFLPQGGTHFQLVPLASRFPPRVFHGQIFTPDKHKVSAPNTPCPKVIQIIRP